MDQSSPPDLRMYDALTAVTGSIEPKGIAAGQP